MAAALPPLSTFFGLSPNFLNGPASIPSRINLLLFGSSSQLVPIEFTNFGINLPPVLLAPITGGPVFEFPPVMINTSGLPGGVAGTPGAGGTTPGTGTQTPIVNNPNSVLGLQGTGSPVNTLTGNGGAQILVRGINNALTGLGGTAGNGSDTTAAIFGNNNKGLLGLLGAGNLPAIGTGGIQFFAPGNGFASEVTGLGGSASVAGTTTEPLGQTSNSLLDLLGITGNTLISNAGTQASLGSHSTGSNATAFPGALFSGTVPQNANASTTTNANLASILALSGLGNSPLIRLF